MKLENLNINQKRPIAYILVGLPGSGKSTWIRNNNFESNTSIISTDDEIEKFAKSQNKTYSEVFDEYVKTAQSSMNSNLNTALERNNNIVWDQTNLGKKKRKSILRRLPSNYYKIAIVFEIDENELRDRLYKRSKTEGKFIPNHILDSMRKSYEQPTNDEGFDKIIYV